MVWSFFRFLLSSDSLLSILTHRCMLTQNVANFHFISFIHAHFIPPFWGWCWWDCTGVIVLAYCGGRMLFAELIGSRSVRCHVTIINLMIANGWIRTWLVFFRSRTQYWKRLFVHWKLHVVGWRFDLFTCFLAGKAFVAKSNYAVFVAHRLQTGHEFASWKEFLLLHLLIQYNET